jgi:DNA modification methylase
MENTLYYGDNLNILREYIQDESVDLIYLDPPFNSKRSYNVLFSTPKGFKSEAQVTAFEDSWTWKEQAEEEYTQILHQSNTDVSEMIRALRSYLNTSDVMAYLVMMTNRLLELHRVLKPSGSLFLHCDPTASHYLKIILDTVFGVNNFRNEIVWDYSFRMMDLPNFFNRKHDIIFFYAKSSNSYFKMPKTEWTKEDLLKSRKQAIHLDENGVEWIWMPGGKGHSKNKLRRVDEIIETGKAISDVWSIPIISSSSKERMGYPTQKPLALLERIIEACSEPGDVVLDPFCGCGTAIHASQKLGRHWIGIDITHLAIGLIERRINEAFPTAKFIVHGTPEDIDSARDLANRDKYEFQYWACSLVKAQPYQNKKKGADWGTDGIIYFQDEKEKAKKIIVSVKGGEHVTRTMIADLKNTVERENGQIGILVTLANPTEPMMKEAISAGFYESPIGKSFPKIQILTIEELLSGSKSPQYPDLAKGGLSFKKSQIEIDKGNQPELFKD